MKMPSFKLSLNKKNLEVAEALKKSKDYVNVTVEGDIIKVSFDWGLNISRLSLGTIGKDLTDTDWNRLLKEIKKTLKEAKIRDFNTELISIHPLKTEQLHIRISPQEKNLIKRAAEIEGISITDFVRIATLRMADETIEKKRIRRMKKEAEEEAREEERKARTYVS